MLLMWGLRVAGEPEKAKGTVKAQALTRPIHPSDANSVRHEGPTAWPWGSAGGLLPDLSPQDQGALPAATLGIFPVLKEGAGSSQMNSSSPSEASQPSTKKTNKTPSKKSTNQPEKPHHQNFLCCK